MRPPPILPPLTSLFPSLSLPFPPPIVAASLRIQTSRIPASDGGPPGRWAAWSPSCGSPVRCVCVLLIYQRGGRDGGAILGHSVDVATAFSPLPLRPDVNTNPKDSPRAGAPRRCFTSSTASMGGRHWRRRRSLAPSHFGDPGSGASATPGSASKSESSADPSRSSAKRESMIRSTKPVRPARVCGGMGRG